MKRNIYQLVVLAALAAVTMFLAGACVEKKGKSCKCCQSPVTEKTYGDKSIVIYNAFTPSSEPFCDSIVVPETPGLCRPNPDTVYMDTINEYFYIKGIEKFYNYLVIRVPGDTTKVYKKFDYSNATFGSDVFTGTMIDSTLWNNPRSRQMASKQFVYELVLYNDKTHKDTLDVVKGEFCLIRNPTDCEVKSCIGHNSVDPLLK